LPQYNGNLIRAIIGLKVEEREIPVLADDEVLIKMEAAPCNPSDIAFIRGGYNIKKSLPAVPGFEGAGLVINTGRLTGQLLHKRVSSFVQEDRDGTWAEYFVAKAKDCIELKDELDFEQGACFSINPFTAYGLVEFAEAVRAPAIVQNAAGGQVAEFVRRFADLKGIQVINIVRKEEHIDELVGKGVKYVLNSTDDNFLKNLTSDITKLDATVAIDAVGGEATALLLNAMPAGSATILYGALSGSTLNNINSFDVIFKENSLLGFNLNNWVKSKDPDEFTAISEEIQNLIITGKMQTKIQGSFPLDDVVNGIRDYIKSLSDGKVLFKP
jgi:NADPH:quinone reductase-like Zn-dependent oxidoreductase